MGYKRKPRQYKLNFQDEDMEGFECLMKSISVDEFVELESLMFRLRGHDMEDKDFDKIFAVIASKIAEWNLEDEKDRPIPPTVRNLRKQDIDFSLSILMAWMSAIASVPGPLPTGSPNGETSQEHLITELANSSQSLPS